MVYYLGRDVKVYLTTESPESQVSVVSNAVSALGGGSGAGGSSTAGVATITVTDTDALLGPVKTIILTTAGGTTITATANADTTTSTNTNTPTFEVSSGSSGSKRIAAAANIATCLNANSKLTATSSSYVVTITQVDKGTDGNTTISGSANGSGADTTTHFTGGTDGVVYSAAIFAENLDEVLGTVDGLTKIADLTGVDLGIGVTDEDVTFMGKKTVLKAEIKKETTISLTRKKNNNVWDVVYNGPTASGEGWSGSAAEDGAYGARWGVIEGSADNWYINSGLMAPKDAVDYGTAIPCFGYRVHIELKSGEEVISVPGCQLTAHTITLNADGTTEETCELISQITPKIGTAINYDRLTAADM